MRFSWIKYLLATLAKPSCNSARGEGRRSSDETFPCHLPLLPRVFANFLPGRLSPPSSPLSHSRLEKRRVFSRRLCISRTNRQPRNAFRRLSTSPLSFRPPLFAAPCRLSGSLRFVSFNLPKRTRGKLLLRWKGEEDREWQEKTKAPWLADFCYFVK